MVLREITNLDPNEDKEIGEILRYAL